MHELDIYRPITNQSLGIVVFVHGGAWIGGNRSFVSISPAIHALRDDGWAIASVSYRLAPQSPVPAAVTDVKRAVRFLRRNATELGLNPSKIVLSGHSAGAHLAALAAVTPGRFEPRADRDTKVDGLIALAGPSWLPSWVRTDANLFGLTPAALANLAFGCDAVDPMGPMDCSREQLRELSPAHHPHPPPTYLAYSPHDRLVPPSQGLAMQRRWRRVSDDHFVWLDLVGSSGHNVEDVNMTALRAFLSAAVLS